MSFDKEFMELIHIYWLFVLYHGALQDLPTVEMLDPQNRKIGFFIEVGVWVVVCVMRLGKCFWVVVCVMRLGKCFKLYIVLIVCWMHI